jgi:hypothetical protein
VSSLVCPHCQTGVRDRASVCLGCGAEIVRGASKRERSIAGCLSGGIGVAIALMVIGFTFQSVAAPNEYGFAVVVGLLLSAMTFNIFGRALVRLLFRSRLRFFRNYRHQ